MTNNIAKEIRREIESSIAIKAALLDDSDIIMQIESLALRCVETLREGGKIIFAGNGGSFADAQHLSAEFSSRFQFDRAPLASLALGTNNSALSAIGNDYGFEQVFSRELQAIAKPNDIFIPISTSGNSLNILAAAKVAGLAQVYTFALTGAEGGALIAVCDCLCVPSKSTPRIQECHIMIGHILCGLIERIIFKGNFDA